MNNKNNLFLGIELGSTRIKAVAIDDKYNPVSSGDYTWSSSFENGIWTYDIEKVWEGLKTALSKAEIKDSISYMGVSGMMHGYLAFDADWNLLAPFRTWQNTITGPAAAELTELFNFNVPQRWSIAHLYQAILNGEEHISEIAHITTLAGYVHYMLTGVNAIGIGEASGMFPIDSENSCYDKKMLESFNKLVADRNIPWKLIDILPKVLVAGENAGTLTKEGSARLAGLLPEGIPFAPPEGDAGTGMTATNAVAQRTGNISAGTSIFSMVVLEKPLKNVYEEIDIVTTPGGRDVAMVHCNNCTNDSNAWVSLISEIAALLDSDATLNDIYPKLYKKS
ncbi:MAG: FGGY family carbohydrate kinase, partial [Oscillospiraceae bacterium]|nr:FGGY family carbohydrate kinase [Oscillospiraceae bacterium]